MYDESRTFSKRIPLTVENIAQRSGLHKTTIYRRWKDRETLVSDAVTEFAATSLPIPSSQGLDADLRAWARSLVTWLNGRAVLAALHSDAARLPEVTEARRRFFSDRFSGAEPQVQAAVDRGEVPPDTDPAELLKAVIAPIYLHLLVTAEPVDESTADTAAAIALVAARSGFLTSRNAAE